MTHEEFEAECKLIRGQINRLVWVWIGLVLIILIPLVAVIEKSDVGDSIKSAVYLGNILWPIPVLYLIGRRLKVRVKNLRCPSCEAMLYGRAGRHARLVLQTGCCGVCGEPVLDEGRTIPAEQRERLHDDSLDERPNMRHLLLGLGLTGLGFSCLFVALYSTRHGITPEKELVLVRTVPVIEKQDRIGSKTFLKMRVGEYLTEYSSESAGFETVFQAINDGVQLDVWISTNKETVFAKNDLRPIYQVSEGARVLVGYGVTVEHRRASSVILWGFSTVVTFFGLWLLGISVRGMRPSREQIR